MEKRRCLKAPRATERGGWGGGPTNANAITKIDIATCALLRVGLCVRRAKCPDVTRVERALLGVESALSLVQLPQEDLTSDLCLDLLVPLRLMSVAARSTYQPILSANSDFGEVVAGACVQVQTQGTDTCGQRSARRSGTRRLHLCLLPLRVLELLLAVVDHARPVVLR